MDPTTLPMHAITARDHTSHSTSDTYRATNHSPLNTHYAPHNTPTADEPPQDMRGTPH